MENTVQKWATRIAPVLVLLATAFGYLLPRDYPVFSPEIGLLVLILIVSGLIIGFICEKAPPLVSGILLGLLYSIFLIFVYGIITKLTHIGAPRIPSQVLRYGLKLFIVFGIPVVICCLIRKNIALCSCVAMVIFMVGSLFTGGSKTVATTGHFSYSTAKPNKLFLVVILDEFAGNSGISGSFPHAAALRRDVADYFTGHNFQLHTGAFSAYPFTIYSIPAMYNLSRPAPKNITMNRRLKLFADLHHAGYTTEYVGTDLLNICKAQKKYRDLSLCISYHVDVRSIHKTDLPALRKLGRVVNIATVTNVTPAIVGFWSGVMGPGHKQKAHVKGDLDVFSGQTVVFSNLDQQLLKNGGNTAIIAHILLPHGAMIYDKNCQIHADGALIQAEAHHNQTRLAYERAYTGQIYCAMKKLGDTLKIVDRRWPESKVIVLGDHGLRLFPFMNNTEDVRLRHAALFAVRGHGIKPGIVSREENLQKLFAWYAGGVTLPASDVLYGDFPDINRQSIYPHKK